MNAYKFSDLSVGMENSFVYDVTKDKQDLFHELSGDDNPLHSDEHFALKNGFTGGIVVYGLLQASLFSRLAGMYLPGLFCVLQNVNVVFSLPVYVNDRLHVLGKIVEIFDSFSRIKVKVLIKNQKQEIVCRGFYIAGVLA